MSAKCHQQTFSRIVTEQPRIKLDQRDAPTPVRSSMRIRRKRNDKTARVIASRCYRQELGP